MSDHAEPQRILHIHQSSPLQLELQSFLVDCRARNLAPGTLRFYRQKLMPLIGFLAKQGIQDVQQVGVAHLRSWLVFLQNSGHNAGGVHGFYRATKIFFRWLQAEEIIDNCPADKLRPPRVPDTVLEPVSVESIKLLLATCKGKSLSDRRDAAIILALWDSGCRASEFVALRFGDLDANSGALLIREGKGRKHRVTFVGTVALREIQRYLRLRGELAGDAPLFATVDGRPMSFWALRDVVRRRSAKAGIKAPGLHAFRRAFSIGLLRNGADIVSLQRLLGHSSLAVVARYLRQSQDDLAAVHGSSGPVDRSIR